METNAPQSLNQYIKWLKTAIKKSHLYDDEEYGKIKKELYQAKRLKDILMTEEKSHRGFGYKYEPIKPVSINSVETPVHDVEVEVMEDTNEG